MPSHWHWQVADFSDDQIDKVSRLPFLSPENVQIVIELPGRRFPSINVGIPNWILDGSNWKITPKWMTGGTPMTKRA